MPQAERRKIDYWFKCERLTAPQRALLMKCCGDYKVVNPRETYPLRRGETEIFKPCRRGELRKSTESRYWRSSTTINLRSDLRWIPIFVRQAKLKKSQYWLCWDVCTGARLETYEVPNIIVSLAMQLRCQLFHGASFISSERNLYQNMGWRWPTKKGNAVLYKNYSLLLKNLPGSACDRLTLKHGCDRFFPSRETRGRAGVEWILRNPTSSWQACRYLSRKRISLKNCELKIHVVYDDFYILRILAIPKDVTELIHSFGLRIRITMQRLSFPLERLKKNVKR